MGPLFISATPKGLKSLTFVPLVAVEAYSTCETNTISALVDQQLDEYFLGTRKNFQLPLDLVGTEFRMKVWEELEKIPFGTTISYLQLAVALGDQKKIRAVGQANGENPIAIIIPCHRVIGSQGKMVGYSGGIENKTALLKHEGYNLLF